MHDDLSPAADAPASAQEPPPRPVRPTRWMIFHHTGEKERKLIEVCDIMECIDGPGDCGWVNAADGKTFLGPMGVIADFEHLFATPKEAIESRIRQLKEQIEERSLELQRWEQENL